MVATGHTARVTHEAAFRGIKRLCYAGLNSISLRTTLHERMASVLPTASATFLTADPDTGLTTHAVTVGVTTDGASYLRAVCPAEEAARIADLVHSRRTAVAVDLARRDWALAATANFHSEPFCAFLRSLGMRHHARAVYAVRGELWGMGCWCRGSEGPPFSQGELRFLRRLAPHIARALRDAELRENAEVVDVPSTPAATPSDPAAARVSGESNGLGLIVIDDRGRIRLRTTAADSYLADLADLRLSRLAPASADRVDYLGTVVVSLLEHLDHAWRRPTATLDDAPLDAQLQVRGRSGRWYTLRAARSEPDSDGRLASVITITGADQRARALTLARRYGLSRREREVIRLAAYGCSAPAIAERLRLSVHTVHDHLEHAATKVGARGKQALLAKLFLDGFDLSPSGH